MRSTLGKRKILILAANPESKAHLRLGEEMREIESGLRAASCRDQFELEQRLAVRPRDLQQALIGERPQIVHFCGHGLSSGDLVLEDDQGRPHGVTPDALAEFFELCCDFVECVVLNACHSRTQAEAIARHIQYVVGMDKLIGDVAAIRYAVGFYDALGAGMPYDYAHKVGRNLLRLENIPEHLTPVMSVGRHPARKSTEFAVLGRMSRDEISGAIQQHKASLASGTEDAETHFHLGLLYQQLRLYDLSVRHFKRAVDLDPGAADSYYYLALASIRGRRPKTLTLQEARAIERYVSTALELDGRQAKYYYLLAAVKQDYYAANGLSVPPPSAASLLESARREEYDSWEVERLLSSVPLSDSHLLAQIRR